MKLRPVYALIYERCRQPNRVWDWCLRADLDQERLFVPAKHKTLAKRVFWWSVWYYLVMKLLGYPLIQASSPLFWILLAK